MLSMYKQLEARIAGQCSDYSPAGVQSYFLCSRTPKTAMELPQNPIQCVRGTVCQGTKVADE